MRKYKIETKQKTHIFVTLLPTRILFVFVRLKAFKLNKYSNKRKPREKNYQFDAEFVVVVVIRICFKLNGLVNQFFLCINCVILIF